MELKGKLIQLLPLQTGEGKNGQWKKQEFILETEGQYPKKVCIAAWGNKIDENLLKEGNNLNVSFEVESREYNSRWYTDVKAWKIEPAGTSTSAPQQQYNASQPSYTPPVQQTSQQTVSSDEIQDDLPF